MLHRLLPSAAARSVERVAKPTTGLRHAPAITVDQAQRGTLP